MTADRRPTFCTLQNIHNVHLTKEVGLIPYAMHKFKNYDAFMATYRNDEYSNLKYTPGLRMEFIPKVSGNWIIDSCLWLIRNAKRIDVLNIYHPVMRTFAHARTYKLLNPGGKIYLKFDGAYGRHNRGTFWKRMCYNWLVKHAYCVSTELDGNDKVLSDDWGRKILCVPNPINPNELSDFRPFSERSNVIFTAGRLGTKQKATEILLDAFVKIAPNIPGWTLKLAGGFEENINIARDFYSAHPELAGRVIFTGDIRDRKEITEMYRDAKIFAFPSRWESFGIALTEAMMNGCFAVATDIPSTRSLTENFRLALGFKVDDVDGLAKNLLYACTHEAEIEPIAREARTIITERCDLRRICDVIADGLS
ncbi:MAG: glycosyltransferase family 4 protein [Synergistaceae bacterium]|nr:glycosyltransferase family 4 protein [Synergistaceae bacterium]